MCDMCINCDQFQIMSLTLVPVSHTLDAELLLSYQIGQYEDAWICRPCADRINYHIENELLKILEYKTKRQFERHLLNPWL